MMLIEQSGFLGSFQAQSSQPGKDTQVNQQGVLERDN